ncbi:DNA polymerase, partial [Xylella fastidiosa subsp. multiplex]|nr:DNA polymerase [Xylella fastidiosa subsp. multiplex]
RGAPITLQRNAEHEPIRQGDDIYKRAYAHSFGIAPQAVTKEQRQIGKVQELALGYGGGVGAFAAFAAMYHIDLEAMAEQAALPPLLLQQAMEALQWT